jgi:hypothetical protein
MQFKVRRQRLVDQRKAAEIIDNEWFISVRVVVQVPRIFVIT